MSPNDVAKADRVGGHSVKAREISTREGQFWTGIPEWAWPGKRGTVTADTVWNWVARNLRADDELWKRDWKWMRDYCDQQLGCTHPDCVAWAMLCTRLQKWGWKAAKQSCDWIDAQWAGAVGSRGNLPGASVGVWGEETCGSAR